MIARNACSPSREIAAHHQRNAQTAAMKIRVSGVDISNMMFTPRGQNLPLSAALLTKRRLAVFVGHLLPRFDEAGGKIMHACGKEDAVIVGSVLAKAG
jgi:hypothetical protein